MSSKAPPGLWRVTLTGGLYGSIRFGDATLRRGDPDSFATLRCRAEELDARLPEGATAVEMPQEDS